MGELLGEGGREKENVDCVVGLDLMLCHVEKVLRTFRYTVHDVREEHFLIKIGILLLGEELRQLDSVRRIDFIFAAQLNM